MRITARLLFVLFILFSAMVVAQEVKKNDDPDKFGNKPSDLGHHTETKPVLTTQQKLDIRSAQVEMFQAKTMLESTPQYKAFLAAQDKMNQTALRIQRETGADPAKWQFTQDLEYVPVHTTTPEKK